MWDHEYEGVWGLGSKSLSPQPQGGAQLTHLSRRTTPSMQAPKRTTLLKSAATSRKAGPLLPLLPPLTPHAGPQGPPCPSLRTPAAEVSCQVQINPLNVCTCVRVDVYMHACVVCLHMPGGDLNTRKCLLPTHPLPQCQAWERIQTREVVTMARMVPTGMDFCASRRSPERLEPAMMPPKTMRLPQGLPRESGQGVWVGKRAHLLLRGRRCQPAQ